MSFRFGDCFVFWFRWVPQEEWNGQRWKSHDSECDPIEEVRRETFIEIGQSNDATLTWLWADSELLLWKKRKETISTHRNRCPKCFIIDAYHISAFSSLVINFGWCEIEITEWFWTNNNNMGNIGLWCNTVNHCGQFATNNIECLWVESVVN